MKVFLLNDKQAFLILSVLFIFIAICRISFPDLDHGDEYTDANVLNAGENFIRFGFIKCKFLPVFEPNLNSPSNAYTHYPPLPDIINGLLRAVFRTESLYFFRAVSLFCSFLNLFFWYFFIKLFTNNPLIALISAVFYLSNPLFIFGIDSLHESCYSELLRSLIFFILIVLTSSLKKQKILFFFLWVLFFLESLITFEYIIYLCVFFALFRLIFSGRLNNKITWRDVLILFSAPVAGFLLHFIQNVWYFGSYASALQDLTKSAVQRIVCGETFTITFNLWWKEVVLKNISLTFLYKNKALVFYAFFSCLLYLRLKNDTHKKDKQLIISLTQLLFILIVSGVSWYVFFPMHSLDHNNVTFLARHLLPAAAITFTIFIYILYISSRKVHTSWKRTLLMIISIIFGIFIVIKGIKISELPITLANIKAAHYFLILKENLLHLKKISQNNDIIGTTIFRYPFIRYYTSRHCQFIPNKSDLISLPQLPHYFIFLVENNIIDLKNNELYNFLNLKYKRINYRPGINFLFFVLKNEGDE